jgi:hypothetical protein
MNNKRILLLIFSVFLYSCVIDYEPVIQPDSESIVVNAFLQPDSLIKVHLYANKLNNNKMEVVGLQGAHVLLKENDKTLYDNLSDSILRLDVYPKVNGKYAIKVSHNDYPAVEAETSIPQTITCKASLDGRIYKVYDFQFPEKETPLWITCSALFQDTVPVQYADLLTNNLLIDNVNRTEGYEFVDVKVGSGAHEGFLRIKPENQPKLTDIEFYPLLMRSIIWDGFLGNEIRLIAASKEYDQYCKTLYQQLASPVGGSEFDAILYQPVDVYSNIKGGRGIFAGKSETFYFFKYVGGGDEEDE